MQQEHAGGKQTQDVYPFSGGALGTHLCSSEYPLRSDEAAAARYHDPDETVLLCIVHLHDGIADEIHVAEQVGSQGALRFWQLHGV
jgi:hypothetical protein